MCDKNGLIVVYCIVDGGYDDFFLWVLRDGGLVDIEDIINGWIFLMCVVCLFGNYDVVEIFLDKGVDINKFDKLGKNVFMVVFMNGYFNMVCLFVECGVDIYL